MMMNKQSGQSLIELMLVMMLIAVAMTSGVMLVVRSLQLSESSRDRQRAISIAKATSEYIKMEKEMTDWGEFTTILDGDTSGYLDDINDMTGSDFEVVITEFKDQDANPDGDDKTNDVQVLFEVRWGDLKGEHTIKEGLFLYKY